ncbi:uncharacterized protein LOC119450704 isoform X3 [Dermacentor silvarum]|uniref:uncharacterized protein LOC119450704 isoform X2 n=1 Tax=Dermacentor silvarum TaxID=543639 RepID=UPI00210069BB|nr:uncharacterized protein LOC119450704 isoform X2 [Dermacentor silvarum]XP_049522114.1 uncharacterized protein LOC119450704 isoform X3 [Dermacentor silvarum]
MALKGPRISPAQEEALVSFIEQHPYLANCTSELWTRVPSSKKNELWASITRTLNAMGPARKHVNRWRNTWAKRCFKYRSEAARLAAVNKSTSDIIQLPGLGGRILSLVGTAPSGAKSGPNFFEEGDEEDEPEGEDSSTCPEDPPAQAPRVSLKEQPGTSSVLHHRPADDEASRPSRRRGANDVIERIVAEQQRQSDLLSQMTEQLQQLVESNRRLEERVGHAMEHIAGQNNQAQVLQQELVSVREAMERSAQAQELIATVLSNPQRPT